MSWWTFSLKPALRYIFCRFGDFLNGPGKVGHVGEAIVGLRLSTFSEKQLSWMSRRCDGRGSSRHAEGLRLAALIRSPRVFSCLFWERVWAESGWTAAPYVMRLKVIRWARVVSEWLGRPAGVLWPPFGGRRRATLTVAR